MTYEQVIELLEKLFRKSNIRADRWTDTALAGTNEVIIVAEIFSVEPISVARLVKRRFEKESA